MRDTGDGGGGGENSERKPYLHGDGELYARHRPGCPPALVARLAKGCRAREHALDVGCGSGQFSTLLARHFRQVTATDANAEPLTAADAHEHIEYRQETAEAMTLPDASVDLVVACQAAHWFDLERFYDEARRVARDGAVIALVSYGIPLIDGAANRAFDSFYHGPLHAYWPAARRHVESGYRTLDFPFAEDALTDRSFSIERHWDWPTLLGYIRSWSALRQAREDGADDLVSRELAALRQACAPDSARHRILWPVTLRAARLAPGPG